VAVIRAPTEAAAGAFLVAIGAFALWQSADLTAGRLGQIGPGMLPRALAVATMLCGAAMIAGAMTGAGAALERWALRGPLFILGAAVAFGLAVRPLGLAVAGPLAIIIGAFASAETKLVETVIFGIVMTAFCIVLFKLMLGLPIPVAPWLLGY
jgi:putative tricarboxylic transport membrane protein